MNPGNLGLAGTLVAIVAGCVLIFATGGLAIPIGIVLLVLGLIALAAQARHGRRAGGPEGDPATRMPGQPLQNDDNTAFVGTGERTDPLAAGRR